MKHIDRVADYISGKLSKEEKKEFEKESKRLDKEQGWKNGKGKKK